MINKISIPLAAILIMTIPTICLSDPSDPLSETSTDKEQLIQKINQQSNQLEEQKKSILEQENRFLDYQKKMKKQIADQQKSLEKLKSLLSSLTPTDNTAAHTSAAQSSEEKSAPSVSASPKRTTGTMEPVGEPPKTSQERRPLEVATIFDQPGVLTPRGSLNLEPSLQFSHSSSDRIALIGYTIIPAITIGLIDVRRISRDSFVASVAARYGITNQIEVEGKIPYVYRTESASTAPFATEADITESSADGNGLGDIEFGVRYQINKTITGPIYIVGLRVKSDTGKDPFEVSYDPRTNLQTESPTGSGFWGIQPSFTVIFPSDPAVFFGSINYMWNIERDVDVVNGVDYGTFDPGDSYGLNFGMGLALNEKASFSLGYEHTIITENTQNGRTLPGEVDIHVGSLIIGYSYLFRENRNFSCSLGVGVTEAAPDVQLTIKMPWNVF